MSQAKTHSATIYPRITVRQLADYMEATETARRAIVRGCKYRRSGRVIQHAKANVIVGRFLRAKDSDTALLREAAQALRHRVADDEFERDLLDQNADYIDRFATIAPALGMPKAATRVSGDPPPLVIAGVEVVVKLACRLRVAPARKVRVGAVMLRYEPGETLASAAAEWQSAFLYGYLLKDPTVGSAEPDHDLCLTLDAYGGVWHLAPTDADRRFMNMERACASIAKRWWGEWPPSAAMSTADEPPPKSLR